MADVPNNMTRKTMKTNHQHYSILAKWFHWFVVLVFAYGIAKQVDNISDLNDRSLLIFEVQFALVFLLLLALRYVYMTKTQTSALPNDAPLWQKTVSTYAHKAMYLALSAIALTGLFIALLFYMGFRDGFLISAVTEVHGMSVSISYYLIALHIAASIYHRLKRDGVWSAMVPYIFKEK